jgi:hypothetical protein
MSLQSLYVSSKRISSLASDEGLLAPLIRPIDLKSFASVCGW